MPENIKKPLRPDFDTTTELWDRIIDDIANQGSPCLETVEKLVNESCQLPPQPDQPDSK